MSWLQDVLDPPEKLREIEASRRMGQDEASPTDLDWTAIWLGAGLQAVAMASWAAVVAMFVLSLDEGMPWLVFAAAVTLPGLVVGMTTRSDHFAHGLLAAIVGSVLGAVAMTVAGALALAPPPSGASPDYGQGLGVAIVFASMVALLLSPLAATFSVVSGRLHRRDAESDATQIGARHF